MKLPENSKEFEAWRETQTANLADSPRIFHVILCDQWTQRELEKLPSNQRKRLYFWNSINQGDFWNLGREVAKFIDKVKPPQSRDVDFFVWKTAVYAIGGNWHYFDEISNRIRSELAKPGVELTVETEKRIEEWSKTWKNEIELNEKRMRNAMKSFSSFSSSSTVFSHQNHELNSNESGNAENQPCVKASGMHRKWFDQQIKRVESKIKDEMKEMEAWKIKLETCAQEVDSMLEMDRFELENEIMLY